jgi:C-terminal processing protease CtpA/Prc
MEFCRRICTVISRTLLVLILALPATAGAGPVPGSPTSLSQHELDNLVAFTKLYGYVRFFHPSDQAAELDWDKFAAYGAERVLGCETQGALISQLHQLFSPIAPTFLIYGAQNHPVGDVGKFLSIDTVGLRPVVWQHLGVGLSEQSVYKSVRLNRKSIDESVAPFGFGNISGSLDPAQVAGKRLTFRASVRTAEGSKAQLWLRVDRGSGKTGFFDNMEDRPIRSTAWRTYEITCLVDSDASRIAFGCMLMGTGKLWMDDVHMLSGEDEIHLPNADFEKDTVGAVPQGWFARPPGYAAEVVSGHAASGTKSVALSAVAVRLAPELFPERPAPGEASIFELPGKITARIPLVLYADSTGTIPHSDETDLDGLRRQMEESLPKTFTGNDRTVRLADIIVAWNVFQHFYPYFDVSGTNWENELRPALASAYADSGQGAHLLTLRKFVARLRDGHGAVSFAQDKARGFVSPIHLGWVEEKLVVTAVFDTSKEMPAVGDVVVEIDGKKAKVALEEEESYTSGATPQWRRVRALSALLTGPESSVQTFAVENPTGKRTCTIARTLSAKTYADIEKEHQRPTGKVADSVYYINLNRSSMAEIDRLMPALAHAQGVICDLREYPNGNQELISHLLNAPDTAAHWMAIPRTIYPDRKKATGFSYSGWLLQPKAPHIAGKVVFLTNAQAVSYAESYLSFIEHYKLADIVGEETAGTNGNINPFLLPGGYRVTWTGMRVTKLDGSQHHAVGIRPTLPVHPTLAAIRAGRDEQFEAALKLIEASVQRADK